MEIALVALFIFLVAWTCYAVTISQGKEEFLCQDCRFNDPELCLKVERPRAILCTSYRNDKEPVSESEYKR